MAAYLQKTYRFTPWRLWWLLIGIAALTVVVLTLVMAYPPDPAMSLPLRTHPPAELAP